MTQGSGTQLVGPKLHSRALRCVPLPAAAALPALARKEMRAMTHEGTRPPAHTQPDSQLPAGSRHLTPACLCLTSTGSRQPEWALSISQAVVNAPDCDAGY